MVFATDASIAKYGWVVLKFFENMYKKQDFT